MASECWLFAGYIAPNGYGYFYVRGSGYGSSPVIAHRVMYENEVGRISDGKQLDHLCRVRACINPEHLEPVTLKENVLRGIGITARNAKKTHCPKGHLLDQISRNKDKAYRRCATCHRNAERQRRIELSLVK